jgi:radical SAM superfamily enzyme YgiQ (UPF0313 family)
VQFVFAPPFKKPKFDEWYEGHIPPLGILYLAAYLRRHIDGLILKATDGLLVGKEQTFQEVMAFEPDVLCVSMLTAVVLGGCELINRVRARLPNTLVIVGGPHATALPEEILARSAADVVVLGEGEETLTELIGLYLNNGTLLTEDLSQVRGIAFRVGAKEAIRTPPRQYIADLDSIPFPARDLLPMRAYRGYYFRKATPEWPMIFTRGCPYDCTFCAEEVWKLTKPVGAFRWRSPESVVDEMEELHYEYGVNEIQDVSDEFNGHLGNSLAICEEKIGRGLDIPWKTLLRAHPLPEYLVRAMAEAGCWQASIGIESANQEVIDGIRKNFTMSQLHESLHLLQRYGIKVQGLFMLFNVWEEEHELRFEDVSMSENTVHFADRLVREGLLNYTGNFNVATPYPGSELYEIALRHGLIKDRMRGNWDAWLIEEPVVMRLPGIPETQQLRLMRAGSISITKCLLSEGDLGFGDFGNLARRALKAVRNELTHRLTFRQCPRGSA